MRYCQPYITERIGAITISKALAKVNTQLENAKIVDASE